MTTLVTGANGFVGRALLGALVREGVNVRAAIRDGSNLRCDEYDSHIPRYTVGNMDAATDWAAALAGVQIVVHLAARVHVMNENPNDLLKAFRQVNTQATERLASMAACAGVRRLVYVSSIKVNGETTPHGPFRADDPPRPSDPYAVSKREAEESLVRVSAETGMEVVIVRPPLVYGPGVGGNFLMMLRWVNRGVPLPFGSIRNQRSLVGVENLVSLLVKCLSHTHAAGEVFLVADDEDLSTPQLLQRVARAMDSKPRVFPFPVGALRLASRVLGRAQVCERLCGSMVVDSGHARRLLGWGPVSSVDEELRRTAEWYRYSGASGASRPHRAVDA